MTSLENEFAKEAKKLKRKVAKKPKRKVAKKTKRKRASRKSVSSFNPSWSWSPVAKKRRQPKRKVKRS